MLAMDSAAAVCPANIPKSARRRDSKRLGRHLKFLEFAVAALIVLVILAIRLGGDRVGWITLLAYGPRWIWTLMPVALVFLRAICRQIAWVSAIAALLSLGLIQNFNVPVRRLAVSNPLSKTTIRVMTLNCNGANTDGKILDRNRLTQLLETEKPDLVMLEECSRDSIAKWWPVGWHLGGRGDVVLASRVPIEESISPSLQHTTLTSSLYVSTLKLRNQEIMAAGVHFESPRFGIEPVLKNPLRGWVDLETVSKIRQDQERRLSDWAKACRSPLVIAGDFNTVADSPLYCTNWYFLSNAFSNAGWGTGTTKTTALWNIRIDQILFSKQFAATASWVGPDVGSDHFPLFADLQAQ